MNVELISYTADPVKVIETAASTCYDSEPTEGKIMKHCYNSGHHSVLEFAEFTFKISGVSRALTHQLVRHRLASFAQRSQRYCKEEDFDYVIPKSILQDPELLKQYKEFMIMTDSLYKKLIASGINAEDARYILPNACATEICVKMDLRELIHFCNERLCTCAQWEIRMLAQQMKNAVEKVSPDCAKYLVPKCEKHSPYNFCTETKKRSCGRHKVISEIINKENN
uniref:Thymidylate synthase complementing protein n=1 Tax=Siphoviridae sp. ctrgt10 TaxID=2826479 RepID=A0A8S5M6U3_9CAUD|nr:MAG TPA: Thymidylate synthase complementing protein [Siphoviridae sp. ctrgt10]